MTSVLAPPPIESQGLATAETTFHKLLLSDLSTDNILTLPEVAGRVDRRRRRAATGW